MTGWILTVLRLPKGLVAGKRSLLEPKDSSSLILFSFFLGMKLPWL